MRPPSEIPQAAALLSNSPSSDKSTLEDTENDLTTTPWTTSTPLLVCCLSLLGLSVETRSAPSQARHTLEPLKAGGAM